MIYTADNLKVCLAASFDAYAVWRDELATAGFRTPSLSLAGPSSAPIYTAVMVKPALGFVGRSWARFGLADPSAQGSLDVFLLTGPAAMNLSRPASSSIASHAVAGSVSLS